MNGRQWHYLVDGRQTGPVAEDNLIQILQSGRLQPETMVWTTGLRDWVQAGSVEGLLPNTEQAPLPFRQGYQQLNPYMQLYAGFWQRFAASFLDGIILWTGGFIVGFILSFAFGVTNAQIERMEIIGNIIGIIIGWLYSALLESSTRQATLGKMAVGIKVTDLEGNRISFGKASGRHFAKIVSTLILFIGFLMIPFTKRKQALHDMMAGCLVVTK